MLEAVQGGPSTTMVVDDYQLLPPLIESVKLLSLRLELKAANDNHLEDAAGIAELRKDLRDLKNGVGFQRAVGQ